MIATPDKFDGKDVAVIGFLHLQFEGNELFLHREDYRNGITKNGIWVDLDSALRGDTEKLNNEYVVLAGTFSATKKGHMGATSGSILAHSGRVTSSPASQKESR